MFGFYFRTFEVSEVLIHSSSPNKPQRFHVTQEDAENKLDLGRRSESWGFMLKGKLDLAKKK